MLGASRPPLAAPRHSTSTPAQPPPSRCQTTSKTVLWRHPNLAPRVATISSDSGAAPQIRIFAYQPSSLRPGRATRANPQNCISRINLSDLPPSHGRRRRSSADGRSRMISSLRAPRAPRWVFLARPRGPPCNPPRHAGPPPRPIVTLEGYPRAAYQSPREGPGDGGDGNAQRGDGVRRFGVHRPLRGQSDGAAGPHRARRGARPRGGAVSSSRDGRGRADRAALRTDPERGHGASEWSTAPTLW